MLGTNVLVLLTDLRLQARLTLRSNCLATLGNFANRPDVIQNTIQDLGVRSSFIAEKNIRLFNLEKVYISMIVPKSIYH